MKYPEKQKILNRKFLKYTSQKQNRKRLKHMKVYLTSLTFLLINFVKKRKKFVTSEEGGYEANSYS